MTLRDMLSVLRKWYWIVLAGALITGAAAAVFSLVWPPTYEARALLLITKLRSNVTLDPRFQTVAEENVVTLSVQEEQVRRQTLVALANSPDLARLVVDRLGDALAPAERSVTAVTKMVDVSTEGNLIAFEAKAADPQKAAKVANAWADAYQEQVNRLYSATAPSDAQIEAEVQSAQSRYEKAKQAVESFLQKSRENELTRQIEQKQQILAGLQGAHLAAARAHMDRLLGRLDRIDRLTLDLQSLKEQLAGAQPSDPLTPGEQFAMLAVEGAALAQEQTYTMTLELGWTTSATLTAGQAIESLDRLTTTLEGSKKAAQAEVERVSLGLLSGEELVAPGQSGADSIDRLQAEIGALQSELEREVLAKTDLVNARDVAQESYLTLVRKADEIQILSQLTGVEVQIAAAAQPPEEPAFPRPLLTTVLGVLAGGLAGLALVFVAEQWPREQRKITST